MIEGAKSAETIILNRQFASSSHPDRGGLSQIGPGMSHKSIDSVQYISLVIQERFNFG
jgi:hypothetical protein